MKESLTEEFRQLARELRQPGTTADQPLGLKGKEGKRPESRRRTPVGVAEKGRGWLRPP